MEKLKYSIRPGLKNARKKMELRQSDLADKMGVTIKTVMNWEQGISAPDLETTIKLAELLQCDIDFLVGRIGEYTHDLHEAHMITGLREEAISSLISLDRWVHAPRIVSDLLLSKELPQLLKAYDSFHMVVKGIGRIESEGFHPWADFRIRDDGRVVMSPGGAVSHYISETSNAMRKICESEWEEMKKDKRLRTYDPEELSEEIAGIESEIKYLTDYLQYLKSDDFPNVPDEP